MRFINVRKLLIAIFTVVSVLASQKVGAQYDPYFSHYFDMQTSYNPAAAGKEAKLNIAAAYAMTMVGFEHAPQTVFLSGDMPFRVMNQVHGVGVQLMSDKIGLFTHQRIAGQYAVRKKIGEKGWLSGGVQAGLLTEAFRGSQIELNDDTDPVFTKSDIEGNGLDLGFGLLYRQSNWYVGISGQHLTYPTITIGETNEISVDGTYYVHGGVDFQLANPLLKFAASGIVLTDCVTYRADVTGRLIYNYDGRTFYGGLTYSPTNSVTLLVGGQFQGVVLGYSFEMYTNGISLRNGSHELFLGYQMDVDLGKKGRNYHQTTRTL